MLTVEQFLNKVTDLISNIFSVTETNPSRDRILPPIELQSATVVTAAETVIGGPINLKLFNSVTIYLDYTKGDETSWDLIIKGLSATGGDEHQLMKFSESGGVITGTAVKWQFTATGKHQITLTKTGNHLDNVRIPNDFIKLYGDATGGTPTGTVQITYSLKNN